MSLPLLLVIGSTGLSCLCLVLKITWWLPASHSAITASLALLPATSFLNMNFWINSLWLESVACYQGWFRIKGRLLWRQNSYDFSQILICQKQRIKLSMGLLWAWIPASLYRSKALKLWSSSIFIVILAMTYIHFYHYVSTVAQLSVLRACFYHAPLKCGHYLLVPFLGFHRLFCPSSLKLFSNLHSLGQSLHLRFP